MLKKKNTWLRTGKAGETFKYLQRRNNDNDSNNTSWKPMHQKACRNKRTHAYYHVTETHSSKSMAETKGPMNSPTQDIIEQLH